MPCRESGTAHRYVAGRLEAQEVESFEIHLLTCERCREEVAIGTRIAPILAAAPVAQPVAASRSPAAARSVLPEHSSARRLPRRWAYATLPFVAAAVVLIIVMGHPRLDDLSRIEPPRFSGAPARSTSGVSNAVDAGMEAYRAADYREAAVKLAQAVESETSPSVAFFLGVSRLATGDARGALGALSIPRSAEGSPYQVEAAYFAAKAHLRLGGADSALAILLAVPPAADAVMRALALADSIRARRE